MFGSRSVSSIDASCKVEKTLRARRRQHPKWSCYLVPNHLLALSGEYFSVALKLIHPPALS